MKSHDLQIRLATPQDAAALVEIYRPYVEHTAITFEYDVPSKEEFAGRIQRTLAKYPYLVALQAGEIAGYTYAGSFHQRPAYAWCAETSIYVRGDKKRQGIGKALYQALEVALKRQNITNLYACIAYPLQDDAFLNKDSEAFHAALGFVRVGTFHRCGYKFGRWYDMIWMEKMIGGHTALPSPFVVWPSVLSAGERKRADESMHP